MNACSPAMARSMSDRIVPDRAIRLRIASVDRTSTTSQTRSERNVQSPWVQHESNNNRYVNIGADHFKPLLRPTAPRDRRCLLGERKCRLVHCTGFHKVRDRRDGVISHGRLNSVIKANQQQRSGRTVPDQLSRQRFYFSPSIE